MKKKRYWAFVLYPESAPSDWKDLLQQTGLCIAISPLHDKDIDPTGLPKKSHYHIILCYDGPTTYNNVKSITDSLNQPIPIPLEQVRGYFRYLTHKDNPDKFQYNDSDIQTLNGFSVDDYNDLTLSQINEYKKKIIVFIKENRITEYSILLDTLLMLEQYNMLDVAMNHTLFINTYICSFRNYLRDTSSN